MHGHLAPADSRSTVRAMPVGLGWRSEIAADLLRQPGCVDFIEVVAEGCYASRAARREACAFAEAWPAVVHGIKLSLGGAEAIEAERARALGRLARDLRAPLITEHVAFVRSGGRDIGHLTPLPFTRAAIAAVERNVDRARRHLPDVPLALENVACTFRWPERDLDEPDFYAEIVRRSGCPLLLDVANLYANAVNDGADPFERARRFPLDQVAMIHVAGGAWQAGFYFDDHAHAVGEGVFSLLAYVLERTGPVPILVERDAAFPPFEEIAAELTRCRGLLSAATGMPSGPSHRARGVIDGADIDELLRQQGEVTRLLTTTDAVAAARIDAAGLARTRGVLERKRVEEALPFLPLLASRRDRLVPLAEGVIRAAPRSRSMVGVSDAWCIAEQARSDAALAELAKRELLVLRSRFVRGHDGVRPRTGPFLGSIETAGKRVWAAKGIGAGARVRVIERGGRR